MPSQVHQLTALELGRVAAGVGDVRARADAERKVGDEQRRSDEAAHHGQRVLQTHDERHKDAHEVILAEEVGGRDAAAPLEVGEHRLRGRSEQRVHVTE